MHYSASVKRQIYKIRQLCIIKNNLHVIPHLEVVGVFFKILLSKGFDLADTLKNKHRRDKEGLFCKPGDQNRHTQQIT